MSALWNDLGLADLFTTARLLSLARAVLVLLVGLVLARGLAAAAGRAAATRWSRQESMLTRRLVFYTLVGLLVASSLHQLGFQLSVLLGAAGILTVALGFASQTSASNLISGLFLIAERPFVVGDVIRVDDVTGEVLSVDLMSVKIRTFDNLYVRVPNEAVIKSRITNLTHFPLRRVDVKLGVAYGTDLGLVQRVLRETAEANPLCLDEPAPLYIFRGFGESSLDIQYNVWGKRENYLDLLNSIHQEIAAAFAAAGIVIPFPQRTLTAAASGDPFPVRVVSDPSPPQT
ncbi:MAG TPA: mechanosensitive ion channel family protein [Candidatus Krumholzibacteria bacterium]|nr:mechanosensitive ion channel family protein [Candidatus Krumholzibacteria bacterium]HRX49850.1 mechanosensitive ion channel family protein [Candidatus Krumholzibacteria bacterium]